MSTVPTSLDVSLKVVQQPCAHTDWHVRQKEVFIHGLTHSLMKRYEETKYSQIYFICPPAIMGIIRASIEPYQRNRPLKDKLNIIEITKDLTSKTIKDIAEYVAAY
jgi:protein required for attachment to host cells